MNPLIAVCISLGIVLLAYLIKHFASEIIEDEHHFILLVIGFFAVYIAAALALGFLIPTPPAQTVSAAPDSYSIDFND